MTTYATGWRNDLEIPGLLAGSAMRAFRRPAAIPDKVDPRSWLKVEDQRQTSSCVGFATSSAAELVYWFANVGKVIQLSRWQAYISAQKEDGLDGRDAGALISGTVRACEKRGICLDELCLFTGRYFTSISSEAWEDAETRQIRQHVQISSFDDAVEWIGGGMGAVIIGVPVDQAFMNNTGLIDRVPTSGGGHALPIVGYIGGIADRRLLMVNSWGTGWGKSGWAEVTRRAFDSWCGMVRGGRTEVWGFTEMEVPEPRDISFVDMIG